MDTNNGTTDTQVAMTEEQQTGAMPTPEKSAEAQETTLPDEVKDRTREEFEKLKAHNAELKAKLEQYEGMEGKDSVLDEIRPRDYVENTQAQEENLQFVDGEGYVDTALIAKQLLEAKKKAEDAQREAMLAKQEIQRFQETAQVRKVHESYPELDPHSEKFDRTFYDFVKNELIGQMTAGQKENLELAAKKAKEIFSRVSQPEAKKEVNKEAIEAREQVSATSSTVSGNSAPTDFDDLVKGTYRGDADAIFARIKASGN